MTALLSGTVPGQLKSNEGRWPKICASTNAQDMRIAMLCYHTSPLAQIGKSRDAGGMNVYVRELACHLGLMGVSVDIFTRWTDPMLPQVISLSTRVRVIHIPAGPIENLHKNLLPQYLEQFADGVNCFAVSHRRDYHIIHSHYWQSAAAGQLLAMRWGAPHIVMFHTLADIKLMHRPEEHETALRKQTEKELIHTANAIIAAAPDEYHHLKFHYHAPEHTLHIIPCGVDMRKFYDRNREEDKAAILQRLQLDDIPTLLFVGRLDPLKGADLAIQAAAKLPRCVNLLLIGGHPEDPERSRLTQAAQELGIASTTRFIDAQPHDVMTRYYHAGDLFLVASYYESFGLAAIEALASGTPVVAFRVGGLPSFIRHGVNGALAEQRNAVTFAEQIANLLENPANMQRTRNNARSSIAEYSWQNISFKMLALYRQLTENSRFVIDTISPAAQACIR